MPFSATHFEKADSPGSWQTTLGWGQRHGEIEKGLS